MSKNKIIQGKCPHCKTDGSVKFTDLYYLNDKYPYATDVPMCDKCNNDSIEIRKINNRRYKIVNGCGYATVDQYNSMVIEPIELKLKELGIQLRNPDGMFRCLEDILKDMSDSWRGNNE